VLAQEVGRANAVLANSPSRGCDVRRVESAASTNVGLAISPTGPPAGAARGEARNFEPLLAFVARLESTAGFANVLLATPSETRRQRHRWRSRSPRTGWRR
jgi:hypothetical protein